MKLFNILILLFTLMAHAQTLSGPAIMDGTYKENAPYVKTLMKLSTDNPADCTAAVPVIAKLQVVYIRFDDNFKQVAAVTRNTAPDDSQNRCGLECNHYGLVIARGGFEETDGKVFHAGDVGSPPENKVISDLPVDDPNNYLYSQLPYADEEPKTYPIPRNGGIKAGPLEFANDISDPCTKLFYAQKIFDDYVLPGDNGVTPEGGERVGDTLVK